MMNMDDEREVKMLWKKSHQLQNSVKYQPAYNLPKENGGAIMAQVQKI